MTKVIPVETFIILFLTMDSVKIYLEKNKQTNKQKKTMKSILNDRLYFFKLVLISTKWFSLDWIFQQRSHKTPEYHTIKAWNYR